MLGYHRMLEREYVSIATSLGSIDFNSTSGDFMVNWGLSGWYLPNYANGIKLLLLVNNSQSILTT